LTSAETAAWVGAVVTFLAVLVALFKEELVPLWRKPTLVARIRLAAPDCHKTELVSSAGGQVLWRAGCYYLRLWVENTGNERAEKVQVFASKLSRRQADATFKVEHSFLPMNLRWAHNQLGVGGPEIFADGISPQMGKHCDLGHIVDPQFREVHANKTVLVLDLEVAPNTRSHLLAPGTYRLDLKLAAANCTPVTKTIEITHTGDWYTEEARMFADGIGMTELT
jgi:hypothetical protein